MNKIENWSKIEGFECYEVSDLGNVRSFKTHKKGKLLKLIIDNRGYYIVNLCNNGTHQKLVHRLVAEQFIENVKGVNIINHKDLNKLNNRVDNLEWCTSRQNISHYYQSIDCYSNFTGVIKAGDKFRATIVIEGKNII